MANCIYFWITWTYKCIVLVYFDYILQNMLKSHCPTALSSCDNKIQIQWNYMYKCVSVFFRTFGSYVHVKTLFLMFYCCCFRGYIKSLYRPKFPSPDPARRGRKSARSGRSKAKSLVRAQSGLLFCCSSVWPPVSKNK